MPTHLKALLLLLALGTPLLLPQGAKAQELEDRIRRTLDQFLRPAPSTTPSTPTLPTVPSRSNPGITNSEGAITRAMNLARQAAERTNGGLEFYRAETSMYGPSERAPYIVNRDKTITFTFLGGAPAQPPTIQSVVTISEDGNRVNVDYNGPIRSAN